MGRNLTRWLIPLPAILFAVFPQTANAEPTPGLATTYYTVDVIPPVRSTSEYPVCGTEVENNINRSYNGEPFEDCTVDLFMVHMTGFITIPEHNTIAFWLATDDGGRINIDGNEWGNWNDRHCSWMASGELQLDAGSQPLELWMYENGGNTCLMLAWNINNTGWAIVPDSAFTTNGVSQTTSTTSSTTTSSSTTTTLPTTTTTTTTSTTTTSTTTTLPEITTTTSSTTSSTTTLPITTTTVQLPTTTQTTTTTTTPPTTTTTTEAPYVPTQTTSTTEPLEEQTTTTTEPENKIEEASTTVPEEILPEETEPEDTLPDEIVPDDEEESPTTTELLEETTTSTEPEEVDDSLDTTIAEEVDTILEEVSTLEEAVEAIINPTVLATITEEQAEELFESLDVEELTEVQVEAIVEALADAPAEVRQAFEAKIDVFAGTFDNYVPEGSNIPVSQRRSIVAIGAVIATATVTKRRG